MKVFSDLKNKKFACNYLLACYKPNEACIIQNHFFSDLVKYLFNIFIYITGKGIITSESNKHLTHPAHGIKLL